MPFDAGNTPKPAFDLQAYMERFCERRDLVSNQPKGISHLSKADQLAYCLEQEHKGLEAFMKGGKS